MARTRSIKPGFFRNESLSELPYQDRLCFAGLWTIADREGRLEDRPKRIRADLFPYDPEIDVEACLLRLHNKGFIIRYVSASTPYICIPAWGKHQNPHVKEQPSTIPAPDKPGAKPEQAGPSTLLPITDSPSTLLPPHRAKPGFLVSDLFEKIWLRHPKKKNRVLSEQAYSSGLDKGRFTSEDFEAAHAAWCATEAWTWKQGNGCPILAEWIEDLGYRVMPPAVNGTRRKSGLDVLNEMQAEERAKNA